MRTFSTIFFESLALTLIIAAVTGAIAPQELGLDTIALHPLWLGVIVLAARYGPIGMISSLAISVSLIAGLDFLGIAGSGLDARLQSQTDLLPFVAAAVTALIAMSHASHRRRLEEVEQVLEADVHEERTLSDSLQEANRYLRQRCDRMDASVRLWRQAARCLERGDLSQAADAALDLCTRRVNARHGYFVEVKGGQLRGISHGQAATGLWEDDKTLLATVADGKLHVVLDIAGADENDSDITIPIRDELDDELLGVIALRGADPTLLCKAELHDLNLVAEWLAPLVARKLKGPRLREASGIAAV